MAETCTRLSISSSDTWNMTKGPYAYHPRGVLKGRCSVNKNDIFGFSVVSYPRPRSDLEKIPPTVSEKNFDKIEWKNNAEQKKINCFAQDSNLSRVVSTLLSPSAICELFLFCSVSHVILILLFNLLMSGYSNLIPSAVIIR